MVLALGGHQANFLVVLELSLKGAKERVKKPLAECVLPIKFNASRTRRLSSCWRASSSARAGARVAARRAVADAMPTR